MRKITAIQTKMLQIIAAEPNNGSYLPSHTMDPLMAKALHKLVLAGRLTVENTDSGGRYHLTTQGREDAAYG